MRGTRNELIPPRNAEELPDNRMTLFFPDVSTETQTQRGECSPLRELLRKLNVELVPWHPAALKTARHKMTKPFLEPGAASRHLGKTGAVGDGRRIMRCAWGGAGSCTAAAAATGFQFCLLKF